MTTDQNKATAISFLERLDKDQSAIEECFASDCVANLPGNPDPTDRAGFQQFVAMLYTAFPDLHHEVEQQIAEGDTVVTVINVKGTHKGDFMGMIPPTGKQVEFEDIMITRFQEGTVVELWAQLDLLMLFQQLGIFQLPG